MSKVKQIFKEEFDLLVEDLKAKHIELGMKASGDWVESLEVVVEEESAKIIANDYTYYLVNGRKAGKFPPIDSIKKWIVDKGIITRAKGKIKLSSLAYLIARKIAENGTKYHQQGGTDLVSAVVTPERMQSIIDKIGAELTLTFVSRIENQFETILTA